MSDTYSTPQAALAAGLTHRQLDYLVRAGLVTPSIHKATGTGQRHAWSPTDVALLARIAALRAQGWTLRAAVRLAHEPAAA